MTSSKPVLAISAIAPIVLLVIMVAFLLGPASSFLQFGVVLPEVSIEKIEFIENCKLVPLLFFLYYIFVSN